ncbi:MAG: hypothetical protein WCF93_03550 [Candidatus Moraniibacteriota bacterium]
MSQDNSKKESDLISQAISNYYQHGNALIALNNLDEAIVLNPLNSFIYQFKTDILIDKGLVEKAEETIAIGLGLFPQNHELYKRRAVVKSSHKKDYSGALDDINIAITLFESNSNNQKDLWTKLNLDKIDFLKDYTSNKVDLVNIREELKRRLDIESLYSHIVLMKNELEERIRDNEDKMNNDKFRYIEILGLFTAVIGFVFANVQKFPTFNSPIEALLFGICLVIPLILFALLIHLIFGNK